MGNDEIAFSRRIRSAVAVQLIAVLGVSVGAAQQTDPPGSVDERRIFLQTAAPSVLIIPVEPLWPAPIARHFGILTILPPDEGGEMLKASLPIGDLANRATRAISNAQRRRAVRKAEGDVLRTLQQLQAPTATLPR
jgi:hypothetical protein